MASHYEVDLPEALQAEDLDHFAYFFLFFWRVAFVQEWTPLPEEGEIFLHYVGDGSDQFDAGLREDIGGDVYDALRLACEGFLRYEPNDLSGGMNDLDGQIVTAASDAAKSASETRWQTP